MMEIITRAQAMAHKPPLKRYFTGKKCKWGHVAERYVDGGCSICARIASKKCADKNREERNVIRRARYRENPEKGRDQVRAWRLANPKADKAAQDRYHQANREKIAARRRARDLANRVLLKVLKEELSLT